MALTLMTLLTLLRRRFKSENLLNFSYVNISELNLLLNKLISESFIF